MSTESRVLSRAMLALQSKVDELYEVTKAQGEWLAKHEDQIFNIEGRMDATAKDDGCGDDGLATERWAERIRAGLQAELDLCKSFHDVAVKERDYERVLNDKLLALLRSVAQQPLTYDGVQNVEVRFGRSTWDAIQKVVKK